MTLKQLRDKRARLLREAEGLRGMDGFANDEARAAFDAKMAEVDEIDEKIREAESVPQPAPAPTAPDATAIRAEAARLERERIAEIRRATRAARLDDAFAQRLIDDGTALDAARSAILQRLEEDQAKNPTRAQGAVTVGEDEAIKQRRGMSAWIAQKAGVSRMIREAAKVHPEHPAFAGFEADPGEFRGLRLLELARRSLERSGERVSARDALEIAGLALRGIGQTTSDFSVALENVLNKTLLAAYMAAPVTWPRFCLRGSVSDFRAHPRYRTGFVGNLDTVLEDGEFKNKAVPDAVKESLTASTVGNIIALTRQAIVNDDMSIFDRIAVQIGQAAQRAPEVAVYALLAQNAGLGPTMGDGVTLFHANHLNISTGAALSAAAIDADRVQMASQKDPAGQDFLDLRPRSLLVPVSLGGTARTINDAQYDPDTANKLQKPNFVRGLFEDVIDTPRLSGTRRYLFADPVIAPVLEVGFLDGQSEPYLEMRDGWRIDGVEWKVRLDFGVAAIGWEGAVTNAGI